MKKKTKNEKSSSILPRWFVYILKCSDNSFYTGITTDPKRRLHEHNETQKGARYTASRRPVHLVYIEEVANRSIASQREYEIKQLHRNDKLQLIQVSL